MKVTLGVYSDHPTPANCAMVGRLDESGVSYRLALDLSLIHIYFQHQIGRAHV